MNKFEFILADPKPIFGESKYGITIRDYLNAISSVLKENFSDFSIDRILTDNVQYNKNPSQDMFIVNAKNEEHAIKLMDIVNDNFKKYLQSKEINSTEFNLLYIKKTNGFNKENYSKSQHSDFYEEYITHIANNKKK